MALRFLKKKKKMCWIIKLAKDWKNIYFYKAQRKNLHWGIFKNECSTTGPSEASDQEEICLEFSPAWGTCRPSCSVYVKSPYLYSHRKPGDVKVRNSLVRQKGLRHLLFSSSVVSDFLWPHGLQCARLSCPSLSPWVCSNSCPLSLWCHSTISSSVTPFSCSQSFPASAFFPMS